MIDQTYYLSADYELVSYEEHEYRLHVSKIGNTLYDTEADIEIPSLVIDGELIPDWKKLKKIWRDRCKQCDALLAARHSLEVELTDETPLIRMIDEAIIEHGHKWMLTEYKADD